MDYLTDVSGSYEETDTEDPDTPPASDEPFGFCDSNIDPALFDQPSIGYLAIAPSTPPTHELQWLKFGEEDFLCNVPLLKPIESSGLIKTGSFRLRCNAGFGHNGNCRFLTRAIEPTESAITFRIEELLPGDLLICQNCFVDLGFHLEAEHFHEVFTNPEAEGISMKRVLSLDSKIHGCLRKWQEKSEDGKMSNKLTAYSWIPPSLPAARPLLVSNYHAGRFKCPMGPKCGKEFSGEEKKSRYARHLSNYLFRHKCKICAIASENDRRPPKGGTSIQKSKGSCGRKTGVANHLEKTHGYEPRPKNKGRNLPTKTLAQIIRNDQNSILERGLEAVPYPESRLYTSCPVWETIYLNIQG